MGLAQMKVLYSALLQQEVGQKPSKQFIEGLLKVLEDKNLDSKEIDTFFEKLGTQEINDVIASGKEKMTVAAVAAAPAAAATGAAPAKAEEKKEEEEQDFDAFDDLF